MRRAKQVEQQRRLASAKQKAERKKTQKLARLARREVRIGNSVGQSPAS